EGIVLVRCESGRPREQGMKKNLMIGRMVLLATLCVTPLLHAEPPPAPKNSLLDWSLGKWVGTRRDAATDQAVKLQLRVEPVLGGLGQIVHLEAEHKEGPYLGFTVRMPTDKPGKWSMTDWNAKRTNPAQLNGEVEATRGVWHSASAEQARHSRLLSERVGEDGWRRTMSISE